MENKQNLLEETSFEKIKRNIKKSIFKFYYNLLTTQFSMTPFYIILLIIEAIQINSIVSLNIGLTKQDETIHSKLTDLIKFLRVIVMFYLPNYHIIASVIMYIFCLLLIIQIVVINYYKNREIDYKNPKKYIFIILLRIVLVLNICYQTIFSLPLFITFFSFFQCSTVNSATNLTNYSDVGCSSMLYYINISISGLSIALFLFITICNCIFLNDNQLASKIPWSGPYNRLHLYRAGLKIMLAFFYTFQFSSPFIELKVYFTSVVTLIIIIIRLISIVSHYKNVFLFNVLLEGSFLFNSALAIVQNYYKTAITYEMFYLQILSSIAFGIVIMKIIQIIHYNFLTENVKYFIIINLDTRNKIQFRSL
jgi:hypothetical protein